MAATVKIAAFGALLRVLYVGLGGLRWDWEPMLWIIAILTMLVGSIIAITQTDIKRMLAYSSIAQAGFILVGVVAVSREGLSSALFYLIAYAFTTIGAFAIIAMVRDSSGEATHLSKWAGLGKKSPLVASIFAIFMLALAGIPLTSGFIGKFGVFAAAIASGADVAGHRRRHRQPDRGVLLRPRDRADVLLRPHARDRLRRRAVRLHHHRAGGRGHGHRSCSASCRSRCSTW